MADSADPPALHCRRDEREVRALLEALRDFGGGITSSASPVKMRDNKVLFFTSPGTIAASPDSSSTHIRWLNPSFEPIVLVTCNSGSSVTPNLRWYMPATASRRSIRATRLFALSFTKSQRPS